MPGKLRLKRSETSSDTRGKYTPTLETILKFVTTNYPYMDEKDQLEMVNVIHTKSRKYEARVLESRGRRSPTEPPKGRSGGWPAMPTDIDPDR